MLADGVVTEDEMAQAYEAVIDCLLGLNLEGLTIATSPPHWSPEEGSLLRWGLVTWIPPDAETP